MASPNKTRPTPTPLYDEGSPFQLSQHIDPNNRALYRATTLASIILGSYAIFNLTQENYDLAIIESIFAILAAEITWLGSSGKLPVQAVSFTLSLFTMFFFSYLVVTGKAFGTGIYWSFLFPFVVFFLNGLHLGLLWAMGYFLINISLLTAMGIGASPLPYSSDILVRAAIAYASFTAFAYFYEQQNFKNRQSILYSGEKFKNLIENSTDIITVIDPVGEFLFISPACETILGYKPEQLCGFNAFEFIHKNDRIRIGKKLARIVMHPGLIERDQAKFKKADGNWCILDLIGKAYTDDKSNISAIVNAHDVTEKKRLESELLQAQKLDAIGILAAGIAHDFNNKLAAMKAVIYLAKNEARNHPSLSKRLDTIDELSTNSAKVVQQLLTFANKDRIKREIYLLNELLEESNTLLKEVIPKNISFTLDICSERLYINGDKSLCQQAVINLLDNARRSFSKQKNPTVRVSLSPFIADERFKKNYHNIQQKLAHLIVEDNGCGIGAADKTHIFEPFFTTRNVGEGSGLGLSMVYGTVTRHGGIIEVESEVGKGTTVHIYIPTAPMPDTVPLTKEKGNSPSAP